MLEHATDIANAPADRQLPAAIDTKIEQPESGRKVFVRGFVVVAVLLALVVTGFSSAHSSKPRLAAIQQQSVRARALAAADREFAPYSSLPHTAVDGMGFGPALSAYRDRVIRYVSAVQQAQAQAASEAEAAAEAEQQATLAQARQRSAPAAVSSNAGNSVTSPGEYSDTLACIRRHESDSAGGYSAKNPTSTASGAYQVLDTTWAGYSGYATARDAPPEVQDQWAREAISQAGTRPWAGSGC